MSESGQSFVTTLPAGATASYRWAGGSSTEASRPAPPGLVHLPVRTRSRPGGAVQGSSAANVTDGGAGLVQTVDGLSPNTTYRLSGRLSVTGASTGYLFVKKYGGSEIHSAIASSSTPTLVSITFTTSATGTAEFGVWRDAGVSGTTLRADDLTITVAP